MSEPKHDLQIVATPASGWCDPVTGVCIIGNPDDEPGDEAASENGA